MIVRLDPGEMAIVRDVAMYRRSVNEMNHVKERLSINNGQSYRTYDDEIIGVMGEFAFAKMMNVCPDFSVSARRGSFDAVTWVGETVDVKTVSKLFFGLNAPVKSAAHADIYVLCVVISDNAVEFVGWVRRDDLIHPQNIKSWGEGRECYSLPPEALNRTFPCATIESSTA